LIIWCATTFSGTPEMTDFLPANRVNFIVLSSIIVDLGTDLLRTLFQFRWYKRYHTDWVEDVASDHLNRHKQPGLRLLEVQWPLVLQSRLLKWDISILAGILRYGNVKVGRNQIAFEAISQILTMRNECYAHITELSTSTQEFNYSYEKLTALFVTIGKEIENWRHQNPDSSAAKNLPRWTATDIDRRMHEMLDMGDHIEKVAEFEARLREMTAEWNRINTRVTRLSQQLFEKIELVHGDTTPRPDESSASSSDMGETSGESSGMGTGEHVPGFELTFYPEKTGTVHFSHVTKITIGDKIQIDEALSAHSISETFREKYIGIERIHRDQPLQLAHIVLTFDHVNATCTASAPGLSDTDKGDRGKYYADGIGGASKSVVIKAGVDPFPMKTGSDFFFWNFKTDGVTVQQKFKIEVHLPRDKHTDEIIPPPY
jgi:hypothetical protein